MDKASVRAMEMGSRARQERQIMALLRRRNPYVVRLFFAFHTAHHLFLVMEYVPGRTLRDVVRAEAPVSPARALALIEPVLSALSAALILGMAAVLARGGPPVALWAVVALSMLAVVANAATHSASERRLWLPVTVVMFFAALAVAL